MKRVPQGSFYTVDSAYISIVTNLHVREHLEFIVK